MIFIFISGKRKMVRDTSIKAYREIKDSGLLGKRETEVYKGIFDHGPCTDRELAEKLGKDDPNYVRPKRRELVKQGLIEEHDKKKCDVSKKTVYVWRIKKDTTFFKFKELRKKHKDPKKDKITSTPDIRDSRYFIERVIAQLKQSDFGENIWYFEKLLYETAGLPLSEGNFEIQSKEPKSMIWETFYSGTEEQVNKALEWNKTNARNIGSGKRFRGIKVSPKSPDKW